MLALQVMGSLGAAIGISAWAWLMNEIRKDGIAPPMKVETHRLQIGAWRENAYTPEAIARRAKAKVQRQLDETIFDAHVTMQVATMAVDRGRRAIRNFDHRDLHRSLNEMVKYSWPKISELNVRPLYLEPRRISLPIS